MSSNTMKCSKILKSAPYFSISYHISVIFYTDTGQCSVDMFKTVSYACSSAEENSPWCMSVIYLVIKLPPRSIKLPHISASDSNTAVNKTGRWGTWYCEGCLWAVKMLKVQYRSLVTVCVAFHFSLRVYTGFLPLQVLGLAKLPLRMCAWCPAMDWSPKQGDISYYLT